MNRGSPDAGGRGATTGFRLGIDALLADPGRRARLKGRRVALLATPASVTGGLVATADALTRVGLKPTAAFGPQHGMRGDKQDNMVETADEFDDRLGIPVFSLYGEVRRPTESMLDYFDVLVFDAQDVGCRIYTFLTTLCYLIEDCARASKSLWVLDRPNPAGRAIEGLRLVPGHESFVGIGPLAMRHGLTLGEAAGWHAATRGLDVDIEVVQMQGYRPDRGWPASALAWVNPSPNMASLNGARCFPGTVLLEGTTLSEGRGTTRPLEVVGAPDLDVDRIVAAMHPQWLEGCGLRRCAFIPTFHKHVGEVCHGFQIHTDHPDLYADDRFTPYRLVATLLKAVRRTHRDYPIWRDFPYEYVTGRLPIDTINGGPRLREWVDDDEAEHGDLDAWLAVDEATWREESTPYHRYRG